MATATERTQLEVYREQGNGLPAEVTYEALVTELQKQGDLVTDSEVTQAWGPVLNKEEKDRLVGVPFVIVDWNFNPGDNGEFVSLRVVTNSNERFIVNDGSTGIYQQVRAFQDKGRDQAILCRGGLTRSDYEKEIDGKAVKATTYYIAAGG